MLSMPMGVGGIPSNLSTVLFFISFANAQKVLWICFEFKQKGLHEDMMIVQSTSAIYNNTHCAHYILCITGLETTITTYMYSVLEISFFAAHVNNMSLSRNLFTTDLYLLPTFSPYLLQHLSPWAKNDPAKNYDPLSDLRAYKIL